MAKGGASSQDMSDVSDWCDINLLESAFRFVVKKGDDATLTDIKKIVDDKKVYDHIQVSAFSTHCDKKTKKMNLSKFKSKMWFELMTKGNTAAAQALAKKIASNEQARQEKEAKGTKKGSDVTSRLTDTSKYTGAHKERFDESGKGKGAEGRVDKVDGSGYVGNYKGQGTFDKK